MNATGDVSGPAGARSGSPPTTAAGLASYLKQGAQSVTSVHVTWTVGVAGNQVTASGDEVRTDGTSKVQFSVSSPQGGVTRIIVIGDKVYLQQPDHGNLLDRPWTLLSPNTTDPALAPLASTLAQVKSSGDIGQYATIARASKKVTLDGPDTVDGVPATHYSIVLDVAKLSPDAERSALAAGGLRTLPLELWVDRQGRTIKTTESLDVSGQRIVETVTLGNFDAPVTISAPPADQVSPS